MKMKECRGRIGMIEDGLGDATTGVQSVGRSRYMDVSEYHKIRVISTVTTFVITGKRVSEDWGYMTSEGQKDWETYRKEKNSRIEVGET